MKTTPVNETGSPTSNPNAQSDARNDAQAEARSETLRKQMDQLRSDLDAVSREFRGLGRDYVTRGKGAARAAGQSAEEQVRSHPLTSVAVSLVAGLLVGLLLSGRRQR